MKIYKELPKKIIRVQISRSGGEFHYLSLTGTTVAKCIATFKMVIGKQKLSPFEGGRKTSVMVRNALGAKNLKGKSFSFRGLSPKETHELLVKYIDDLNKK